MIIFDYIFISIQEEVETVRVFHTKPGRPRPSRIPSGKHLSAPRPSVKYVITSCKIYRCPLNYHHAPCGHWRTLEQIVVRGARVASRRKEISECYSRKGSNTRTYEGTTYLVNYDGEMGQTFSGRSYEVTIEVIVTKTLLIQKNSNHDS